MTVQLPRSPFLARHFSGYPTQALDRVRRATSVKCHSKSRRAPCVNPARSPLRRFEASILGAPYRSRPLVSLFFARSVRPARRKTGNAPNSASEGNRTASKHRKIASCRWGDLDRFSRSELHRPANDYERSRFRGDMRLRRIALRQLCNCSRAATGLGLRN